MGKTRVHIFNPEFDYAMGEYSPGFTPPGAVVELRKKLSFTPYRYADPATDLVLLLDDLPQETVDFYSASTGVGTLTPGCAIDTFLSGYERGERYEFLPWGWTPDLRHHLQMWGVRENELPADTELRNLRMLSHRSTTIGFNTHLNRQLHAMGFAAKHLSPIPCEFRDVNEAMEYLDRYSDVFYKYPWSSSGRGVKRVTTSDSRDKARQWIAGAIRRQKSVMAELYFKKVLDFATLWHVSKGEPEYLGLSVFSTSPSGKYEENIVASPSELTEIICKVCPDFGRVFIEAQAKAIREVARGYTGYLGIDMMGAPDGSIRGGVELNFRMTMGIVALLEQERRASGHSINH